MRVYGGSVRAWECVNTARDLEIRTHSSNLFLTLRMFIFRNTDFIDFVCSSLLQKRWWLQYSAHAYYPISKGCSALHAVADVACLCGECIVFTAVFKGTSSPDGHSCVSTCKCLRARTRSPCEALKRVLKLLPSLPVRKFLLFRYHSGGLASDYSFGQSSFIVDLSFADITSDPPRTFVV